MRSVFLILMIALLPLRAWTGDAMATQMATELAVHSAHAPVAIENRATHILETGAIRSFEPAKNVVNLAATTHSCQDQMAAQHDAGDSKISSGSSDHCGTCIACQVCHTVALSPALLTANIQFASPPLRQISAAAFTSADAALGQKPPIA